jgi:hypothetical protein
LCLAIVGGREREEKIHLRLTMGEFYRALNDIKEVNTAFSKAQELGYTGKS